MDPQNPMQQPPAPEVPVSPQSPAPEMVQPVQPAPAEPVVAQPQPVAAPQPAPVTPVQNQPFGPAPQPMAPAPMPTIGSAPIGSGGGMGSGSKFPVKLVAGLVSGLAVLAIVLLGVYFGFFYVSKADYQKAADAYNSLKAVSDDIANSSSDSSPTDGNTSALADKFDSKADDFQKKFDDMGKLKAVQKDSQINKAYSDLKSDVKNEVSSVHAVATFLRAFGDGCTSITTRADIQTCVGKLQSVKTDSSAVNDYAGNLAQYLQDISDKGYSNVSQSDSTSKFRDAIKKLDDDTKSKSEALKNAINDKLK